MVKILMMSETAIIHARTHARRHARRMKAHKCACVRACRANVFGMLFLLVLSSLLKLDLIVSIGD